MVDSRLAASFWSAVKDCLVTFHNQPPGVAAENVIRFWTSLSNTPVVATEGELGDMVYHSEPWYIACNLAQSELPLVEHLQAYQEILSRNGLSSQAPYQLEPFPSTASPSRWIYR